MKLKDRIAIVTGGGSGIGRATALLFASEGATIIVADTDEKTGKETVQLIISANGNAEFVTCDVSQSPDVRKLTDTAVNKFEKIDILFNNAGIAGQHPVTEISEADWDRVLAVNLRGVFLCSKYAIPHMVKNGGGVIVNTASAVGLVGSAGQASYCASKGGVVLLTKAMALDYAKDNIRVNCICPGVVRTPLVERFLSGFKGEERAKMEEMFRSVSPLNRYSQPEEIARGVLYLASDDASFVTGIALPIDGGWTAH